jgi:hypothetical protein
VRWTSLKILKLMETAVSVPAWEYFSLVSLLTLAWLYFVLDFHFLADLLRGLRGDPIRLFYNSKSKIPAQVLQQCRVLKERCISITFTGSSDQLIRAKQINFCCSLMWFCVMVGNCNLHCDHVWPPDFTPSLIHKCRLMHPSVILNCCQSVQKGLRIYLPSFL